MAEKIYGLTHGAAQLVSEMAAKHRQRLPDAGRRTRRVWPHGGGIGGGGTGSDCNCCPGCGCYPDADHIKTGCAAVPCLYNTYTIVGDLPFAATRTLAYIAATCTFESDVFNVTLCPGTAVVKNLGNHFWRLTVAGGINDSKLELINSGGTALTLEYYSRWYFNPLCNNEFGYKPLCATMSTLSFSPTRTICVKPVADDCVPCVVPNIPTDCCPTYGYPANILATFTGACATLNGTSVVLKYQGALYWEAAITLGSCGSMIIGLSIAGLDYPCNWQFTIQNAAKTQTCVDLGGSFTADQCPLVSLTSPNITWTNGPSSCGCCANGSTFTVTLSPA